MNKLSLILVCAVVSVSQVSRGAEEKMTESLSKANLRSFFISKAPETLKAKFEKSVTPDTFESLRLNQFKALIERTESELTSSIKAQALQENYGTLISQFRELIRDIKSPGTPEWWAGEIVSYVLNTKKTECGIEDEGVLCIPGTDDTNDF